MFWHFDRFVNVIADRRPPLDIGFPQGSPNRPILKEVVAPFCWRTTDAASSTPWTPLEIFLATYRAKTHGSQNRWLIAAIDSASGVPCPLPFGSGDSSSYWLLKLSYFYNLYKGRKSPEKNIKQARSTVFCWKVNEENKLMHPSLIATNVASVATSSGIAEQIIETPNPISRRRSSNRTHAYNNFRRSSFELCFPDRIWLWKRSLSTLLLADRYLTYRSNKNSG